MIRFALPLIALAAGACVANPQPGAGPAAPGVECNANGLQGLIGKTRSETLTAEAMRLSGASIVRYISPGMAVTMDFRVERLSIDLDANDKVTGAHCG